MDVGFIGLGMMGSRIAGRLVNAGHRLRVWNRSPAPVDALVKMGARRAADARDAFSGDVVLSMLADDAAVHSVIDGLIDGAPKGLVHVNMSTISIALAHELSERHSARGLAYVAATVFGRPDLAVLLDQVHDRTLPLRLGRHRGGGDGADRARRQGPPHDPPAGPAHRRAAHRDRLFGQPRL